MFQVRGINQNTNDDLFYGETADYCFPVLENIFVNISKTVVMKIQKNIFNSITSLQ